MALHVAWRQGGWRSHDRPNQQSSLDKRSAIRGLCYSMRSIANTDRRRFGLMVAIVMEAVVPTPASIKGQYILDEQC